MIKVVVVSCTSTRLKRNLVVLQSWIENETFALYENSSVYYLWKGPEGPRSLKIMSVRHEGRQKGTNVIFFWIQVSHWSEVYASHLVSDIYCMNSMAFKELSLHWAFFEIQRSASLLAEIMLKRGKSWVRLEALGNVLNVSLIDCEFFQTFY